MEDQLAQTIRCDILNSSINFKEERMESTGKLNFGNKFNN